MIDTKDRLWGYFLVLWGLTFVLGGAANTVFNASQFPLLSAADDPTKIAFAGGALGSLAQVLAGAVLLTIGSKAFQK